MMGWVRFENTMPDSLEVAPVSDKAFRLWVNAICYCSRAGEGDVLSPLTLRSLSLSPRTATGTIRELCEAGLVEPVAGGYRVLGPWRSVRTARWIPRWLRAAVIKRDGHVCQLCGGPVKPGDMHIDHVTPVVRGGGETLGNLQVAHGFCNMSKGSRG